MLTITTTTLTTVQDLLDAAARAVAEGHTPETPLKLSRASEKPLRDCWCGCGGKTKSSFVPGHDSKLHSLAKKVARGQTDTTLEEALAALPHDDAREDFQTHHDSEKPLHEAREAEKARKEAEKEATA